MKDFDIIDRKYTTVSRVQAILALLAFLPIIAITLHLNPAIGLWGERLFKKALLTAIALPGVYALLLGMAFPIVSMLRGEMSRRALLVTLVIFTLLTILLHIPAYISLPELNSLHPTRPGSTVWMNYLQGISFYATFTGYATGFAIGALIALAVPRAQRPGREVQ